MKSSSDLRNPHHTREVKYQGELVPVGFRATGSIKHKGVIWTYSTKAFMVEEVASEHGRKGFQIQIQGFYPAFQKGTVRILSKDRNYWQIYDDDEKDAIFKKVTLDVRRSLVRYGFPFNKTR